MSGRTIARYLGAAWLLLVACDDYPEVARSFDEIRDFDLNVKVSTGTQVARVEVWVSGHDGDLRLPEEFAVAVGDYWSMRGRDQIDRGGARTDDAFVSASIRMQVPAELRLDGAIVTVTDGKTAIELPVGNGLLPRSATWIQPADGVLHGNELLSIAWSPVTDLSAMTVTSRFTSFDLIPPAVASVDGVVWGKTYELIGTRDDTLLLDWKLPWVEQGCLSGRCTVGVDGGVGLDVRIDAPAP